MNDISFKSYIKIGSNSEFLRETGSFGKKCFVDYPWTLKETAIGENVYTKSIHDCSSLGITDGIKAMLFHLCPNDMTNWNKKAIEKMIKKNFDLASGDVQAIMVGSKPKSRYLPYSSDFFDYVKSVPDNLKIPCSSFKGGNYTHNLAYIKSKDLWLISNELMDNEIYRNMTPEQKFDFTFYRTKIADTDEFIK